MRYIGNKTRLLPFLRDVLKRRRVRPGRALDPFTGTASVARELKWLGYDVIASDLMHYAYVFARAYVEVARAPKFARLAGIVGKPSVTTRDVVAYLNRLAPAPGFVHEHYTPAGHDGRRHGRMYFTPENGARIDAVRATLERWRARALLDDDGYYVLLAALLEAADRVANTTGVYASFVKSWQPNARRPLELHAVRVVPGNGCRAERLDALAMVEAAGPMDLLYLDPPYNARQYPAYYHIPELLATGWFAAAPRLRGKTGLLPDDDRRSDWARRGRCESAFEELVARAHFRHLVLSYNTEGILPEPAIERVLKAHGRARTYRRYERRYKRYRSDADGANRRYRGNEVREYLYCVER